ncbi:thioredoxin domain-containing protein [Candidatus Magnetominusculus xianensis]|uniref:Thioredoxin n=1 Tax=Candidatus Magnetominusculus xianensis TaxID=1748249 RepID=A0ABR5SB41_9BACT|nr:thioredoxin domain-containing protein [Candidatus Magnetominusculus xianensis]KWT74996.1 thioredoxin [Candidatus Magnetominusculus xianensis]MBF0404927.1 thioredoxin domain-containing protein [Nitrospirota bacterium]
MTKNRLKDEKSPYLLQHADNPVNWYAWSDEAFNAATAEDKPIFLSIGYSTCHWCHVMKRESFEDTEVAALMNDTFISIKLDREERPDIDNIYMTACQMMTGGGGWPLTIIMFPDGRPFFAATYIPKQNRGSMAGMMFLVPRVKQAWRHERDELIRTADYVTALMRENALKSTTSVQPITKITEIMQITYRAVASSFDNINGGFGSAPKFPVAHNILFLLRYYQNTGEAAALKMAEKTLHAMRMGGIYDQLGYGFHRYSTDASWHVPHFEKMLYDQALLLMAYTGAYTVTADEFYKRTAYEITAYVLRDMLGAEGGFYSAEDAESEGVEGKFYFWTYEQLRATLSPEETAAVIEVFGVTENPQSGGINNILHMVKAESQLNLERRTLINTAREKLFKARQTRIPPHKDDKILTDLNGLMAAALAIAGRAFNDNSLISAASAAVGFIERTMAAEPGGLMHRYRDGQSAISGMINDYASVIWALVELYEATSDNACLVSAKKYMDYLIEHFWDFEGGGFFFTDKASETLIVRQKEFYDGAVPSGNSIALYNMLRLSKILGDQQLDKMSHELIAAASAVFHPLYQGHILIMA